MSDFDERTQALVDEFAKQFGEQPTWIAIGPGRVNLIGEHTDYNDGFVLPVALQRDVRLAVRAREDRLVRIYSSEYDDWGEFDLDAIAYQQEKLWINYVQGVAPCWRRPAWQLTGIDAVLSGNVPRASGLSSSAALEVASIKGLMAAAGVQDALSGTQIAKIAQRAENEFVGVNCGIMDQFISVLGVEGHALLIDCRSLDYELVPFPANASLVIGNTKAPARWPAAPTTSAAGSARRAWPCSSRCCRRSPRCVMSPASNWRRTRLCCSEIVYRRCRHVVSENERVLQTVEALKRDDLASRRPAHVGQPCQPARRLRSQQRRIGCHGRGHGQRGRLLRRTADRGRLWRLRHRPGRAGQRTGRGRRHLPGLSQGHQHLARGLHDPGQCGGAGGRGTIGNGDW